MHYYIKADRFFYPYGTRPGGYLEIKDGRFGDYRTELPDNVELLDYSGYCIAPGLVDTHIHGFSGIDVMDNDLEGLLGQMSEGLLSAGVTSWLPTLLTADQEKILQICQSIGNHYREAKGAKIRGIFLEGPYFTEAHKGAQNPLYMRDPNLEEFEGWKDAAQGLLRKIALAPEREGTVDFVEAVTEEGVAVALGHSASTLEEATRAVEAGASIWVHTYNGMSGLNHREPGMVGGAFSLSDVYTELICDGHHVHPTAAKILLELKGADHVVLITDAMRAAGMPDGEYLLGEFPVIVENGAARLRDGESLAGSVLLLKDAVKNVVDWGIATEEEAITMASLTAAKSVDIENHCGQIKKGREADFIVLKSDMSLEAVYLDGERRIGK